MHLQIERADGVVRIQAINPAANEEAFDWVEIPAELILLLSWYNNRETADDAWLCQLGQLIAQQNEQPPTEKRAYNTWAIAVQAVASLLRAGAFAHAEQLLNLHYVMVRHQTVFMKRQNDDVVIVPQRQAGREFGHVYQREILAAITSDKDLLKKVLAAGEAFMNETDR